MRDYLAKHLFLFRHGERGAKNTLNDKNLPRIESLAILLNPFIDKEYRVCLVSSHDRVAVDTALAFGDALDRINNSHFFGDTLDVQRALAFSIQDRQKPFVDFLASAPYSTFIAVGHLESVNLLPARIRRELLEIKKTPVEFGNDYLHGVYIDLKTGVYREFSPENLLEPCS